MVFSSATFLFFFLPIVLCIYYVTPCKYRNIVLLIASVCFYAFGEFAYLYVLVFTCIHAYVSAKLIHRFTKYRNILLCCSILISIGVFIYFKYLDFIIGNINMFFNTHMQLQYVLLPLGISFYTFQCMSYVIDVYRGSVQACNHFLNFATYITMFPQLVAGPIVRYQDVEKQMEKRTYSAEQMSYGIQRFILGLSKKTILANSMGELLTVTSSLSQSVLLYWIQAFAFLFQLYFDFSGYSDMAIGLGAMFGFHFQENFNYPFISRSITDFWRRWHISLSSWFKDYVYIPLKGNRVSSLRLCFNVLVVWSLTGLWHGAKWNFVLWGVYFACFLLIEKLWIKQVLQTHRWMGHLYTILFVVLGFVFFQYDSMEAIHRILAMIGLGTVPYWNADVVYYFQSYSVLLLVCCACATPLFHHNCFMKDRKEHLNWLKFVLYFLLFLICIAFIVDASFQPFLYFRF